MDLYFFLGGIAIIAAYTTVPVEESDFNNTIFSGKTLKVFDNHWKFCKGDNLAYAKANFDDSQWQNIKINTPLAKNNQIKFFLVNYI